MTINMQVCKNPHLRLKKTKQKLPSCTLLTKFVRKGYTFFFAEKASQGLKKTKTTKKVLRSVFTVSIFLLILHSPLGFVTQEAVAAVVPCIDFKIAMNHRWLFSGPTMLHIISLHFTLLLLVFVFHRRLIGSLVASSVLACTAFCCTLFFCFVFQSTSRRFL